MSYPDLPASLIQALEGAALVPAPEVLLRLMRAVEDEACSMEQIAAIVDKDPAISARILAAANSSAFHRGRSLNSIEECLQVLGLRVVRSIAVCLSVQCVFASHGDNRIELGAFWYHSLLAAEMARGLAAAAAYARPGEAYLGGLLHDLGELALLSALRQDYAATLAEAGNEAALCALEFERFGATHAEVGAWLVDRWHLDSTLADSVLFHHASPAQIGDADILARVVWCAHLLAAADPEGEPALYEQVAALLGQDAQAIATQLTQARERVLQLAAALGMTLDTAPRTALPLASHVAAAASASGATGGLLESMAETTLLQALQREAAGTADAPGGVLRAIAESLRILFGIEQAAFMHLDARGELLCGASGQQAVLSGLRLPLASSQSLAVRALRERRPFGTLDAEPPLALADIQISRALRSEGLLCLPLWRGQAPLGVLLLGAAPVQQTQLRTRAAWLQGFARVAAAGLEQHLEAQAASGAAPASPGAPARELQIRRFSHEVGNPLSIIKSYLRLLEHKVPADSGVQEELQVLREEIERVVRIVRQLAEPALPAAGSRVDLNALVADLLRLYGESLFGQRGIAVELSLDPQAPCVRGDADGIKQILLNLLKNAAEALPVDARVEVETSAAMLHEGVRYAGFVVRDNGPGIPLAAVQRLYAAPEQLPAGKRGMGLSIVGGLVRHMQGRVACETRPGAGARIGILLPPADADRDNDVDTSMNDAGEP